MSLLAVRSSDSQLRETVRAQCGAIAHLDALTTSTCRHVTAQLLRSGRQPEARPKTARIFCSCVAPEEARNQRWVSHPNLLICFEIVRVDARIVSGDTLPSQHAPLDPGIASVVR